MKPKPLILWILFMLGMGCTSPSSQEAKNKKAEEAVPVQVVKAQKSAMPLEVTTVGTVFPFKEVIITPKIAGKIEKIYFKEGDTVKAGEVILKLDQVDFVLAVKQAEAALATARATLANLLAGTRSEKVEQAKAALHQAQANLTNIEKEFQRIQRLAAIEAVAQRQLDATRAQYEIASAQVKQAQEQLDMLKKGATEEEIAIARAQVKQAEANLAVASNYLKDTLIRAPFAGLVTARFVDEGVQVYTAPKTDILKITDLSRVKIVSPVSERDFSKIKVGTPAEIKIDALAGEMFKGQITRIIPEISPSSRNFNAEVEMPNRLLRLRGGMFANLRFLVGQKETIILTRETLLTDPVTGVSYAFVVEGDQAARRKLTLGERSGFLVEVLEGVKEGESIVVKGQNKLKPGSRVKIITESLRESS